MQLRKGKQCLRKAAFVKRIKRILCQLKPIESRSFFFQANRFIDFSLSCGTTEKEEAMLFWSSSKFYLPLRECGASNGVDDTRLVCGGTAGRKLIRQPFICESYECAFRAVEMKYYPATFARDRWWALCMCVCVCVCGYVCLNKTIIKPGNFFHSNRAALKMNENGNGHSIYNNSLKASSKLNPFTMKSVLPVRNGLKIPGDVIYGKLIWNVALSLFLLKTWFLPQELQRRKSKGPAPRWCRPRRRIPLLC